MYGTLNRLSTVTRIAQEMGCYSACVKGGRIWLQMISFSLLATGTGKDKGVWAGLELLQGKCEALGKTNPSGLSFLPNIGLF